MCIRDRFKTPIVSIRGFARLLQGGNLTDASMQEYIDVIEMESARLANLATNVMNMTRVENMAILKDVSNFNLSEQIRSCILLFENQWEEKNINMDVDFSEHEIRANMDLLREVWINLIDNSMKFSPAGGTISFRIKNYSLPDLSLIHIFRTFEEEFLRKSVFRTITFRIRL